MSRVDVSTIVSRIEEARGRVRAKFTEVANRTPSPILREIASQGVIGTLSDRVPDAGLLQGKGPIISGISNILSPRTETAKIEEKIEKTEEPPKVKKKENTESYGSIQL